MTGAEDHALDIDDLRVRFDTDEGPLLAVDGLSLRLAAGEVLALVGESGCGKTMTALAVLGLPPPGARVTGAVRLNGRELTGLDARRLRAVRGRDIAMVFQEPMTSLNPVFTVGRQIAEVLRRHHGLRGEAARRRSAELLDLVRMPAPDRRLEEYPHQMSGGMRQRVMIAMAIACDPAVLIADEPTTALDLTIQAQILDILRDLRDRLGMAILLITHNLGVVADIADRVAVMYAGHKVEEAVAGELFAAPQHPYTTGLLAAVPRPGMRAAGLRLAAIPGLVPLLREEPGRCVFADRCPLAVDDCLVRMPDLAEVRPAHHAACIRAGELDREVQPT